MFDEMKDGTGAFSDVYGAFEGIEEDHGFGDDTLPRGWYPVEITRAEGEAIGGNNTPRIRLGLRVLDGPYANRVAFVDVFLIDFFDRAQLAEKPKFASMTKGFLKALGAGLVPGVDPNAFPSTGEAAVVAYAPETWVGKRFLAKIDVETVDKQVKSAEKRGVDVDVSKMRDRNRLTSWYAPDDEKHGFEWWKEKELPKQLAAQGGGKSASPQVL